jgi:hypothetical protein
VPKEQGEQPTKDDALSMMVRVMGETKQQTPKEKSGVSGGSSSVIVAYRSITSVNQP